MQGKIGRFIKNISYTFTAQITSLIISVIMVLVIPKLVGVEQFGYYQLYLFFAGYVSVLNFGWSDGIFLRVGGQKYSELSKESYSCQIKALTFLEVVIYFLIACAVSVSSCEIDRKITLISVCVAAIIINPRYVLLYILQGTGRIKEYAAVTIIERICAFLGSFLFIVLGYKDAVYLLLADIIGKIASCACGIWFCKELVFAKPIRITAIKEEIKENLSSGIKLSLSTLSGMLIIGVVRFGIQNHWNIATFGKVSIALSMSNMVVQAINAISVVLYPTLRRIEHEQLPAVYGIIRVMLMSLIFAGLVVYYPMQKILSLWLPQYAESLRYAVILFPACAYECKMAMLIITYYKTMRFEKLLMICNIVTLCLSVVLTALATMVFDNVLMAVFTILLVLMFRCVVSEIILSFKLGIRVWTDIVSELAMIMLFIIAHWYLGLWGMIIYVCGCAIYYLYKRKKIKDVICFVKNQ